jgi:hypothetical protein
MSIDVSEEHVASITSVEDQLWLLPDSSWFLASTPEVGGDMYFPKRRLTFLLPRRYTPGWALAFLF